MNSIRKIIARACLSVACAAAPFSVAGAPIDGADPLVAVDRNRASIIDDLVTAFRDDARLSGGEDAFRDRLSKLRADRLLAASLASNWTTLQSMLDRVDRSEAARLQQPTSKALGDGDRDLVYTPLTPCRLVDTRGFGAPIQGGAFFPGARRTYTPAGACAIPASGVASMMISFTTQNLTPSSGGYLAILSPGAPVTATVDIFNFNSVWSAGSTAVRTGTAGQFDVYVNGATAEVIIDVVGYFAPPPGVAGNLLPADCAANQVARRNSAGTAWVCSNEVAVDTIAVREDGSIREQTNQTTVLTRVGVGQYCINAPGANESAQGTIQTGTATNHILVSMGIASFCSGIGNITVQTFTAAGAPTDVRWTALWRTGPTF
jgi:hypothetical protein